MRYIIAIIWIASCYGQTASRYTIATVAGNGTSGFSGDGGDPVAAQLASPHGVALNASGTLFIADQFNQRIRQIQGGAISSIAGNGTRGYAGDGAAATSANLTTPTGVAVDSSGNIYIADAGNNVVRRFTPGGNITTVAGKNSAGAGFAGDGGAATDAQLNTPMGVAVDPSGNLYIADYNNHRIRKVSTSGTITTIAGNGGASAFGDGVAAVSASLNHPVSVAVDAAGNILIGDRDNHRVRKISLDGIITTVAGTGTRGYSGDLGAATNAQLNYPSGVAADNMGNIYIVDNANSRIRRVTASGTITTIAGNGRSANNGDGGLATSASLFFPTGIAVDSTGNVYFTDNQNNTIRKLTPMAEFSLPPTISGIIGASAFGAPRSVTPGSWIEIYGSDLAISARGWAASDFRNQAAPTVLDGTSVTVGGQPAHVSYVSGGQVNALIPMGLAPGAQPVVVTSVVGASEPMTVQVDSTHAAIFAPASLILSGRQYAGALFPGASLTYVLPGPAPGVNNWRRAKAGDTITFYGVGFGPVSPNVPQGQIAQQNNALTGSVQILFGDTPATVSYAGLSPGSVGLYQFNVVVPAGLASDAVPVSIFFNGTKLEQTLYTAVE